MQCFIVPEVTQSEDHDFCKTISSLKVTGFSGWVSNVSVYLAECQRAQWRLLLHTSFWVSVAPLKLIQVITRLHAHALVHHYTKTSNDQVTSCVSLFEMRGFILSLPTQWPILVWAPARSVASEGWRLSGRACSHSLSHDANSFLSLLLKHLCTHWL